MKSKFIGYFDYTVISTYLGLAAAVVGILFILHGNYTERAVICLMAAGTLDMFDGRIARTKKNRSAREKSFGIQIDSLADLISFGVFPAVIAYGVGMTGWWFSPVLIIYVWAAMTRLSYFNVEEIERQSRSEDFRKSYTGLPVTSVALILPFFYSFRHVFWGFEYIWAAVMLLIAAAFVLKFKTPKPGLRGLLIILGVGVAEFIWMLIMLH